MITLALNMYCQGVDPGLDFSHILAVREKYERLTRMKVDERTPYAGDLVFTAFSGSHQDAISKGMAWRSEGRSGKRWDVPYLPIDPEDIIKSSIAALVSAVNRMARSENITGGSAGDQNEQGQSHAPGIRADSGGNRRERRL